MKRQIKQTNNKDTFVHLGSKLKFNEDDTIIIHLLVTTRNTRRQVVAEIVLALNLAVSPLCSVNLLSRQLGFSLELEAHPAS